MHRCGSTVRAKIHTQLSFSLDLPYQLCSGFGNSGNSSDCNVKKAQRYLWSAEQLGISRAETPKEASLESFGKLSQFDKKSRKDDVVWRLAKGNSWKASLLRYFWNSGSIWHWQNSKFLLLLLFFVVTITICKNEIHLLAGKRPWSHLVLVLSPLRGTARGLHPADQTHHMLLDLP